MTNKKNEDHDLILFKKINEYCSQKSLSLIKNIYLNNKTNKKIIEDICLKSIEQDFIDALKYLHTMREDVLLNFNKSIVKATVHHNINILDYLLQITHTIDKPVILKDIIRIATREKNIKIIDYAIDQGADSNQAILYATKDFKPILTNFLMAKSEKQELNQIFKNKKNTTQKGLKI